MDIDYLREGLKELFVKFNKNFNVQRLKKNGEGESDFVKNDSIVVSEVFNFFLSGAQFEGVIKPYVKNYDIQPAISLNDINRLQKGNGGNGEIHTLHLTISGGEGSEEDNSNDNGDNGSNKEQSSIQVPLPQKKIKEFRNIGNRERPKWVTIYE